MAVQVRQPTKDDNTGKLLKLGAMAAGAALTGGTAGAMLGGALTGGAAADVGMNLLGSNSQPSQGASPMERRYNSMAQPPPVQDPMKALEDARVALAGQPPEVQQQYLPAIQAAQLKARRDSGGMA